MSKGVFTPILRLLFTLTGVAFTHGLVSPHTERVITNHLRTFSEVIGQLMCLDQEQQEYKIQEVLCSELFENMENLYSFHGWLQTHTDLCTSTVPCHIPECKAYLAMGSSNL